MSKIMMVLIGRDEQISFSFFGHLTLLIVAKAIEGISIGSKTAILGDVVGSCAKLGTSRNVGAVGKSKRNFSDAREIDW